MTDALFCISSQHREMTRRWIETEAERQDNPETAETADDIKKRLLAKLNQSKEEGPQNESI